MKMKNANSNRCFIVIQIQKIILQLVLYLHVSCYLRLHIHLLLMPGREERENLSGHPQPEHIQDYLQIYIQCHISL